MKKIASRELEISVQAGKIVGTLYDALLKQYADPSAPETLQALNKLCVRLVFCFYAEDADIFDKNVFRKLVSATPADRLRRTLLTLFQVLDTPVDRRDKYLEPELAVFPYTNGGLYRDATEDEIPPMTEEIRQLLISGLDYVAAWFKRAFDYMSVHPETHSAFVASNSLVQGESVSLITPVRLALGSQIDFAWRTFAWDNEAEEQAHVHVVIIGFSKCGAPEKVLFDERGERHAVKSINGYLAEGTDRVLKSRSSNINPSPVKVHQGSPSADDKQLSMSRLVRDELVAKHPELDSVLLPYVGGDEYINSVGFERYCIWMVGKKASDFLHIPEMHERFRHIHDFRLTCATDRVRKTADVPHLFTQIRQPQGAYILIPRVSSEKRDYLPVGFMPESVIASEATVVVDGGTLVDFGLISSSVHNAWMRAVCGRLEMRYRYSPAVYYNFPQPTLDDAARTKIAETAQGILDARDVYAERPLADIYGEDMYFYPEVMKAHKANDAAVLAAYGFSPEATECEIVSRLFDLYEKLTGGEGGTQE